MAYLVVILLVVYVLIAVLLVTMVLHYGNLAWQCNALVGFFCHTDWQCADDGSGVAPGTYNSLGQLVSPDDMQCHLKALYGADLGDSCPGYTTRTANPCAIVDPDTGLASPAPNVYPCDNPDPITGLCSGTFNNSSNINGVTNQSNAPGSSSPQYGLGFKPDSNESPFQCACYFGTNVIANSGTPGGSTQFNSNSGTGGGKYNIGAIACSQILNLFAPQ